MATSTDEIVLQATAVSKRFGGVAAVSDLTFGVRRGEVLGLMGPNGAGKTTVLNLLTGIFECDSGRISFNGETISGLPAHEVAGRGLSRTYQNVRLFEGLTVLEQVVCGAHLRRASRGWQSVLMVPSERRERLKCVEQADALLTRVGVDQRDSVATTLSYGVQRRVEVARALASEPTVLLLDEPTAGMNHAESTALGDLVRNLSEEGLTVLLIEHNMSLIRDFCDRALVMNFGQRIAYGSPQDCLNDKDVQEAYFGRSADADRIVTLRKLRGN